MMTGQLYYFNFYFFHLTDQPSDVTTWQKQLKAIYKTRRGGIGFIPGFPKEFSSDEFFVELKLLKEQKTPMQIKQVKLKTYTDLLQLKSTEGKSLNHVLVSGLAGTGKTTLISRLAYQWATFHDNNHFNKESLTLEFSAEPTSESSPLSSFSSFESFLNFTFNCDSEVSPSESNSDLPRELMSDSCSESSYSSDSSSLPFSFTSFESFLNFTFNCDSELSTKSPSEPNSDLPRKLMSDSISESSYSSDSLDFHHRYLYYHHSSDSSESDSSLDSELCNHLGSFTLLFALDIRRFQANQDLIDAIREQLLCLVPKKKLQNYISCNASRCLFLFDGFDELGSNDKILSDNMLCGCHTIVTTRPNKTDKFIINNDHYVQVTLKGFSHNSIIMFVESFFSTQEENKKEGREQAKLLLKKICTVQDTFNLSKFPLMLAMMCIIWKHEQSLPSTISALYHKVIEYLIKHWRTRESKQQADVQEILIKLGNIALQGLYNNSQLIFEESDFNSPDTVEEGCILGLMTKYCTVSGFDKVTNVSFIHTTFQEYCAAMYLTNLAESDADLFTTYLLMMETDNMEYVLKFSCGMNQNAAKLILSFFVDQSCQRMKHLKAAGGIFGIGCPRSEGADPVRLPLILLFEAESQFGFNESLHEILKTLVSSTSLICASIDYEYRSILQHYLQMHAIPHAWPSFVEEVSIYDSDLHCPLTPGNMLEYFSNLHVLIVKGLCCNVTSLVFKIMEREMTCHSIEVLDFDDGCTCDISAIKAFLDTQLNLTTLTIPPPPQGKSINHVTILEQVFQEMNARSGLITRIAGEWIDDQLIPNVSLYCHILEKLFVHPYTNITPAGFQTLFEAIITSGRKLQQLSLIQDQYEGKSKHTAKSLPLKCLDLTKCNLSHSAYTLADAMAYVTFLEYVDLHDSKLNEKHFNKLGPAFTHLLKLSSLDLSENNIGNSFLAVAQGINACKLTNLNIDNTNLTEESNKALASMKLPLLIKLSLNRADVTSVGAEAISLSLKYIPQLTKLNLSNNNIGSEGAKALSASLKYIPQLTDLNLSNNNIGSDGARALSVSFRYTPDLTELILSNNNIGSDGAQKLSTSFKFLLKLCHLYLHCNPIGPEGIEDIFKHLAHLKCLQSLDLQQLIRKPTYTATNKHSLLQECINLKAFKLSKKCKDISEEYWYDMVLDSYEISEINAVVQQRTH